MPYTVAISDSFHCSCCVVVFMKPVHCMYFKVISWAFVPLGNRVRKVRQNDGSDVFVRI